MASLTPQFFQIILAIEGEFQAMPSDTGNYCNGELIGTKYGMSAGTVGTWWGRCPSVQEMKELTTSDAAAFYAWFFDRVNLFPIENQKFFELLANAAMGSPANAAKVAQRVLNQIGYQVSVDGVFGPQTIAALNDAWRRDGSKVYNTIREAWIQYYKDLNRPEFIDGWLYRMNKYFPALGVTASGVAASGGIIIAAGLLILFLASKKRA